MTTDPQRDAKLSQWLRAVRHVPLDSRSGDYVQLDGELMGPPGPRGVVHGYRNGDGWYDVHPLIREHVEQLAAANEAAANA